MAALGRRIPIAGGPLLAESRHRAAASNLWSPPGSGAEVAVGVPPELAGCHPLDPQEPAVEIGDVVEAQVVADVRDVPVRLHQQQAGAADGRAVDEVDEIVAGRAPEEA